MSPNKPLADAKLEKLVGQIVVVFLHNGRAITGRLLSFDADSLNVEGEALDEDTDPVVARKDITVFRRATKWEAARHLRKRNGPTP